GYRRLDHPIRFRQCESHMLTSLSKGQRERAVSGGCGTGRPKPCADTVAPRAAPEIGPYRLPDFHADTADRFGPSVAPNAPAIVPQCRQERTPGVAGIGKCYGIPGHTHGLSPGGVTPIMCATAHVRSSRGLM